MEILESIFSNAPNTDLRPVSQRSILQSECEILLRCCQAKPCSSPRDGPESPRSGLLHRSPPIEGSGETRLLLVLDPMDGPEETI
ncbi:MAG: hypothetical protein N838_33150 [Thiohalocapsa sp. PB-PSB1]|nr:MAG: hypothetical protein N838_33150 [Thiohalocapsa sp. PB-PSB1]